MDNHSYNLVKAAIKRSESIWKTNEYLKDSSMCPECQALWKSLADFDKQALEQIKKVLESHAKQGVIR